MHLSLGSKWLCNSISSAGILLAPGQLLIGFGPGYFIPGVNEYDFFASSDLMKRFPALILDGSVIFLG